MWMDWPPYLRMSRGAQALGVAAVAAMRLYLGNAGACPAVSSCTYALGALSTIVPPAIPYHAIPCHRCTRNSMCRGRERRLPARGGRER